MHVLFPYHTSCTTGRYGFVRDMWGVVCRFVLQICGLVPLQICVSSICQSILLQNSPLVSFPARLHPLTWENGQVNHVKFLGLALVVV